MSSHNNRAAACKQTAVGRTQEEFASNEVAGREGGISKRNGRLSLPSPFPVLLPLSPPLFSPSFHISSFLSLQNRHNFFCGSQGNGSKCRVQVIWKGRSEKKLAMPLPLLPYKHKKITAVLLATSSLFREPVQRLIDLAKNMCIYFIAASVQHACTDLKIMLKTCFPLWFPNSFFFPFGG